MKRVRSDIRSDIDFSETTSKDLKEIRKLLRRREREIWESKLTKLILPDFIVKPFGHLADFKFELHVASFTVMFVLSDAPDFYEEHGFTHKNQLPDGCLRIDIEAKTQDGTKHGYCGKYSLRYSDLAKIEFRALDKYSYRDVLTMCKLDYSIHTSIHTEEAPDRWIVTKESSGEF